jgi:hypothetical protein
MPAHLCLRVPIIARKFGIDVRAVRYELFLHRAGHCRNAVLDKKKHRAINAFFGMNRIDGGTR